MSEVILTNAAIVTRSEVFNGTIRFNPDGIMRIDEGTTSVANAVDCEGDLVLPGLIEMHTDNVEKHFEPRPGVIWPSPLAAVVAHDAQMASAGITTVLDALSVGDYSTEQTRRRLLERMVSGLKEGIAADALRAEHWLHMRCEVSDPGVVEMFEPYAEEPIVRLISVMDHTPGQRQWRDVEKMRQFHSRKRTYTDAELEAFIADRKAKQAEYADRHRRSVLDLWKPRGLPVASHDDTTSEHIEEGARDGVTISEFPTTALAAREARATGMGTVMGSPNLVRGGSHSGNISAGELADAGLLDGLSSDYVPVSLLHGALKLEEDHGFSLPQAIATVTANVADMLAFTDRGELVPGKRGDVVRVQRVGGSLAVVRSVWRAGLRVA